MYNIKTIGEMLGPEIKVCLVMKSDAYGHGIENLVEKAVLSSPAYIAAVYNSEFSTIQKEIKKQKKDIKFLRIAPVTRDELIQSIINGLEVEEIFGSLEHAKMISAVSRELTEMLGRDITINVHIFIETGMGRMGFKNISDIKAAMKLPGIKIKGVMTHFARASEEGPAGEEMTRGQTEKFDNLVGGLGLDKSVIRHIANSAAAAKFPWTRKDMIRIGSLTYGEQEEDLRGLDPKYKLKPVMTSYKSKVALIEEDVPAHSPVGYDSLQYTRKTGPSNVEQELAA